jgi:UDP-glucose 4-epimerase
VRLPGLYFRNNVANGLNLLDAMVTHDVRLLVFSSTAAVYGEPQQVPICEEHPKAPLNPYGESKWFFESILRRYTHAHGLRFMALRYFNASGADPAGDIGEDHSPESHLIPIIIQAALGQRPHITRNGA